MVLTSAQGYPHHVHVLPTVTLVVATSVAVFALLISGLSLCLHWARGQEHPDVSEVRKQTQELSLAHADLVDKVTHWQRRDRVRKLRESREQPQEEAFTDPKALKADLRSRVFGLPKVGTDG